MAGKTIGIVGGGQLGRMLIEAAHGLGLRAIVLDPDPQSPAAQIADEHIKAELGDDKALAELAKKSDAVTYEIERAMGEPMYKDKYLQKLFLQKNNIATAEFCDGQQFAPPFILKAKHDAYDGRGNATVMKSTDLPIALAKLKGKELYSEKLVPFVKELAGVGARDAKGTIKLFPIVQTIHTDHICDLVLAPAPISDKARHNAEELTRRVLEHLKGVGVFAVEMFLLADDTVLVNEIAPRVHNSGHLTIEANQTSQFEQHIRAVMGMELGDTSMKVKAAVMKNILGDRTGVAQPSGVAEAKALPGVSVHIYGKVETRLQRKMGHITAVADTVEKSQANAEQARKLISI